MGKKGIKEEKHVFMKKCTIKQYFDLTYNKSLYSMGIMENKKVIFSFFKK